MPSPDVSVEEAGKPPAIEGVSMTTTAFVGPTLIGPTSNGPPLTGPTTPSLLTSFQDYLRLYGGLEDLPGSSTATPATPASQRRNYVAHAARAFFDNGGMRLYVLRVAGRGKQLPTVAGYRRAFSLLRKLPDVALVAAPGSSARDAGTRAAIEQALIAHAARPGLHRMAIVDPPPGLDITAVLDWRQGLGADAGRAALYYPWLTVANPLSAAGGAQPAELDLPPSGFVCGVIVRATLERGVHKAPTDEVVTLALRSGTPISNTEQDQLNPAGVNCLRTFPGRGLRVWGGRSLSQDAEWKYISVRRTVDYLQVSIERGLQWVVFEPNGERLWANVRASINDFLLSQWQDGVLQGSKPEEAYFVRCDRSTMTQADVDRGRLVALIGLATMKPAEFVTFRIGLKTANAG
jgi:hypothetical protein